MPPADGYQVISVDDFSPGIFDDWFAAGGAIKAPPGSAQRTGTFGCCATRTGALGPAPRRVSRIVEPTIDTDGTLDGTQRTMAFRCMSPLWDRTGVAAGQSGVIKVMPDLLAFVFESFAAVGGGTYSHDALLRVYKTFMEDAVDPASVGSYDVASHSAGTWDPASDVLRYGWSGIDLSRDNYTTPTIIGYPIVAFVYTDNLDVTEFEDLAYPDTAAPTADGSASMDGLAQSGGFAGYSIFSHQDRILLIDRSVNINAGADAEVPTDLIIGTAINDIKTTGVDLVNYVAENPGLFGAWASVNASEALFVKQQRGGFVIRGDVQAPTVVRLPGLPPTGDAINIAVTARDGKVYYGSRNGVYAWSGGDTADLVSRQLDGYFWKPDKSDDNLHTKGSFAALDRFVFAPNSFFYDFEGKGWWRLNDASADDFLSYAFYDISANGNFVAVPGWTSTTQQVIADYYDIYDGQSHYEFVSQPLMAVQDREVEFRGVTITAEGHGQIRLTMARFNDDDDEAVMDIDEDRPVTQYFPLGVQSYDAIYKLTARATVDTDPAPQVISLRFQYRERMTASGVVA